MSMFRSSHTTRLSVNWEQLRNTLRPDVAIDYQSKNRLARLPSTSDWIFEDDSFKKWENGEAAIPLLWIRGGLGSGKSVIAASIIHRLEGRAKTSSSLRRFAVAYFYCRHDMNNPQPVHTAFRTLMDQLARQIPVLAIAISELLELWGLLGNPESLLQHPIWEILQELDLDGYLDERFYWVIDGVDELPAQERRDLFIILKDALLRYRKLSILVLSRVEVDIIKELESLRACCISVTSERTERDILAYIEHLVGAWGFLGSEAVRETVVGTIFKKANGLFLWVKLIMDELDTVIDPDQVEVVLAGFPEDMKEVYNRILVNLFSRDTQNNMLSELAVALSPFGKFTPDSLKASFVRICGPLLELRDFNHQSSSVETALRNPDYPTVHLTHASLADYLCLSNDPACAFSVDEIAGHQKIAYFCIEYFRDAIQRPMFYPVEEATLYELGRYMVGKLAESWSSRGPEPIDFDSPTDDLSDQYYVHPFVRNAFPLLQYTQEYWFRHVQLNARLGPLPIAFVEKLLSVLAFGSTLHILSSLRISLIGPEILTNDFIALFADLPPKGEWQFEYLRALLLSVAKENRTAWPDWDRPKAIALETENNHLHHEQISSRSSLAFFRQAVRSERSGDFERAFCSYLQAFDLDNLLDQILAILKQPASTETFIPETLNVLESCSSLQLFILGSLLQRNGSRLNTVFSTMDSSDHELQKLEVKARLLAVSGDYLDAAGLYYEASCLDPERWDLKEARFSLLVKAERYREAKEVLQLWGKEDHWCEGAWLCRREANLAKVSKEYGKSIDIYVQGIEHFPICWELYRDATLLFTRLGRPLHVARVHERARTQLSLEFLASKELINLYMQANQIAGTISIANALTVNYRDRWDSYATLWKDLSSGQPPEKISTTFERLTRQSDPRWEPFVYLAYSYIDIKSYDRAIAACEAALEIKKHSSIAWTMAKAYKLKGNLDAALDVLLSGFEEVESRGVHANALIGVQLYKDHRLDHYYTEIDFLSRKTNKWEPLRWSLLNMNRMASGGSAEINWTGFDEECLALAEFMMGNFVAAKEWCMNLLRGGKAANLHNRHTLLAVILSCLGNDVAAFQQSLLIVADGPTSRWQELGRFALDFGALKLMASCFDIDLQIRNHGSAAGIGENAARTSLEVRHWGIQCDGCSTAEFSGARHECVECRDFQFCSECFSTLRAGHETGHGFVKFPTEFYPRWTEAELDFMMKGDGQETVALSA